VGGEDRVVGLDDSGGHLRSGVYGETEFGLFAVVNGQALEEERAETGAGTTTDSVEDHETLEASAVVGELADAVEGEVDDLLANGVVATGVVVGSVFFTRDQLLRMKQLAVGASADFVNDGRLEVEENAARDMFASTGLREEGVESIIAAANGLVGRHLAIGLDPVFQAVQFPAGITNLNTSLAEVEREDFTHCLEEKDGDTR